ncbi:MAG: terminase large subunit domain-containing protein [Lawsonibacter sp.]
MTNYRARAMRVGDAGANDAPARVRGCGVQVEHKGGNYLGREAMIRADMESVGIYSPIFDGTIRQLAKTERELSRAEKTWKAAGGKMVAELVNKTGGTYTAKDPNYAIVDQLRKDVLSLRAQLGLTPASYARAKRKQQDYAQPTKGRLSELLAAARETAAEQAGAYAAQVDHYVDGVLSGDCTVCEEIRQACQRYLDDLASGRWDFRPEPANEIIAIIETTICHQQGEFLDATPLRGTPFYLLSYHKFIVYNVMGFYLKGTQERRFKEALDFVPRKNIKTTFAAALAWALALYESRSGSKVYEVGGALKQAMEGFDFLRYNIKREKLTTDDDPVNGLRIVDNNMEHSISGDLGDEGFISINALASSVDKQDSFNCNIVIADEMHTYKSAKQYQVLKDATKSYTNKLIIGISSGGDLATGFCARRVEYCRKILNGTIRGPEADAIFAFIAAAPRMESGEVDYTNPQVMECCNPGWGHSIRPQDMINDAMQAKEDPQLRPEFFQKSLNVFIASLKAWFNVEEFRASDSKYSWKLEELSRLRIRWYGGSDLSKLYDLTTACLFGHYNGVDIIIPHCWFPLAAAAVKAHEDQIPLFGWQEDGWLDMSNGKVTNHSEVVRWYKGLRSAGFQIQLVGHDRKFCREYFLEMKKAHFRVKDQPQLFTRKSEGFKYLENSAKKGTLYYLHAEPFEYCVQNVRAELKADDMVMYDKLQPNLRIDVFDAAVFACCAYLEDLERVQKEKNWFGEESE